MGDIADWYLDQAYQEEFENQEKISRAYTYYKQGVLTWTTKSGDKILISEMTSNHIDNCIKLLNKKNSKDDYIIAIINILQKELDARKLKN